MISSIRHTCSVAVILGTISSGLQLTTLPVSSGLQLKTLPKERLLSDVCLLRHGESELNKLNCFAGWTDTPLTSHGRTEAQDVARLLRRDKVIKGKFDVVFTSKLQRAYDTAAIVCKELGYDAKVMIHQDWRLNEQMYGGLTGMNKARAIVKFGHDQVYKWRRGWSEGPPSHLAGTGETTGWEPVGCQNGRSCDVEEGSYEAAHVGTESFQEIRERVKEWWDEKVVPEVASGSRVLIVGHGNMLRALLQSMEDLSPTQTKELTIPRCNPIHYQFTTSDTDLDSESSGGRRKSMAILPFQDPSASPPSSLSGRFLSPPETVNRAIALELKALTSIGTDSLY